MVVVYRLLTCDSVEISMMEKQISKKKLERLTISGGDFRKAGVRSESTNLTINKLRKLLEDDVNDLMKRGGKCDMAASLQDIKGDNVNTCDITEEELNLIMNRDLLFPVLENEVAQVTPVKDTTLGLGNSPSSTQSSSSKRKLNQEKENYSDISVRTVPPVVTAGVPLEGRMYDIISVEQFSLSLS